MGVRPGLIRFGARSLILHRVFASALYSHPTVSA